MLLITVFGLLWPVTLTTASRAVNSCPRNLNCFSIPMFRPRYSGKRSRLEQRLVRGWHRRCHKDREERYHLPGGNQDTFHAEGCAHRGITGNGTE